MVTLTVDLPADRYTYFRQGGIAAFQNCRMCMPTPMSLAGRTSERDDALVERQLVFVHLGRSAVWRRDGVLVD